MVKIFKNKYFILILAVLIVGVGVYLYFGEQDAGANKEQDKNGNVATEHVSGLSEDQLEANSYYILHNKRFYPLMVNVSANFDDTDSSTTNNTRVMQTTKASFKQIPTLYLGNGDKLVYYNPKSALSYSTFERFTDAGYSLGFYGLSTEYGSIYTIPFDSENNGDNDAPYIYSASDAAILQKDFPDEDVSVSIAKIGGKSIQPNTITNAGFIKGLKSGKQYDVDIYGGTTYKHYLLTADTHYLTGMELYAIDKVPLVEKTYQEIEIPDYMLDGYYVPDMGGVFRLVTGTHYTKNTDFNKRLLEINSSTENGVSAPTKDEETSLYSENQQLNQYYPTQPGSFGYQSEDEEADTIDADSSTNSNDTSVSAADIPEAKVVQVPVHLQKDKEYKFTVTSSEGTGDIYLASDQNTKASKKETKNGQYRYTLKIKNNKDADDTLTISGLTKDFKYNADGAEVKDTSAVSSSNALSSLPSDSTTVSDSTNANNATDDTGANAQGDTGAEPSLSEETSQDDVAEGTVR